MPNNRFVVGKEARKESAEDFVRGRARYVCDLGFPKMLVGKLLYTKHPFARIRRIDTSRAKAIPGVVTILTYEDIPGENSYLHIIPDQPLLCSDIVRYQGDAVACLAAETEEAAQAGLEAIDVEYEPLVGVFDPLKALEPGAPQIWPDRSNLLDKLVIESGDITSGFNEADVVIENTYQTQLVEHAFLETEEAIAVIDPLTGRIIIYTSSQWPYQDRLQIARALGVQQNMVQVIIPAVGGAFGGKVEAHVQIHAALLAHASGRPVKIVRTREESILTHVKRHPAIAYYKMGAKYNGKLTAVDVKLFLDTGPYANAGLGVFAAMGDTVSGPYNVPNARLESNLVMTNNPISGAMRGYGITQASFFYEAQMEALAYELKIDPVELRLINGLETGNKVPSGSVIREGLPMKACIREAAKQAGWNSRKNMERQPSPHLRRGMGIAATWHTVGLGRVMADHASATLEMGTDGSVVLKTGAVELGQGSHTALTQLAAEALGVPLSTVRVSGLDTDITPDAITTEASRQTYVSGHAVLRAAQPITDSLLTTAGEITGFPKETLSFHDGFLYREGERLNVTIPEVSAKTFERNRQLIATGFYALEYTGKYAEEDYIFNREVFIFSCDIATVLVDIETGEIKVEEIVSIHWPGTVVNPKAARGQVTGGTTMGFGYSTMEQLIVNNGHTENLTLDKYLIPTVNDIPRINVGFIETPEPLGPMGANGLGEAPVNPVAPAIRNAVWDAIGVPINDLPLSPEKILEAIKKYND